MSGPMDDALPNDLPTYMEEFVGWRGWTVDRYGLLHSINGGEVWTPEEAFEATCQKGKSHEYVPSNKCTCGLYATKTLRKLQTNGYHHHGAFGLVSLWGHFIDGGEGWRFQYAYPRVIYVPYLSWRVAKTLEHYLVPVTVMNPFTEIEPPIPPIN